MSSICLIVEAFEHSEFSIYDILLDALNLSRRVLIPVKVRWSDLEVVVYPENSIDYLVELYHATYREVHQKEFESVPTGLGNLFGDEKK